MKEHQSQCPNEPVECQFEEAGCDMKPLRSELDDHMTQNTQQHLMLMMGAFQKLKEEFQQLKEENREMKEEYNERLEYLEDEVGPRDCIPSPEPDRNRVTTVPPSQAPQPCIFESLDDWTIEG